MSDSQRFPVAAHILAYLAHSQADAPARAVSSATLAASVPTNPVVVRRVAGMLAKAGLIATRPGAHGGAWLLEPAQGITLDRVLRAVGGAANLGCPNAGVSGCPVGERIPRQVEKVLTAADQAASERLSRIVITDLLDEARPI
ncbi:Rrf2 family transcriptional regulator [Brevundimonas sp. 2R-24]|uniref:Rrf2 family transcriptional regulator n=1 Tax=Peiella sedimenti TaxID=3061083 RepID=A0ABT8SKI6_9CAUL|nr:Rrf2 family transcriptional regulator [Caulobacteraceae bacterium XZ-24]